jgi:hypothetical protein
VEVVAAVPRFQVVAVRVIVEVATGGDPTPIVRAVTKALDEHLHPLPIPPNGPGWPFGAAIRYDALVRAVMSAQVGGRAAVRSVKLLDYTVDGRSVTGCSDFPILPHSLLWPAGHRVVVTRSAP